MRVIFRVWGVRSGHRVVGTERGRLGCCTCSCWCSVGMRFVATVLTILSLRRRHNRLVISHSHRHLALFLVIVIFVFIAVINTTAIIIIIVRIIAASIVSMFLFGLLDPCRAISLQPFLKLLSWWLWRLRCSRCCCICRRATRCSGKPRHQHPDRLSEGPLNGALSGVPFGFFCCVVAARGALQTALPSARMLMTGA